jgi:hypothetical protein
MYASRTLTTTMNKVYLLPTTCFSPYCLLPTPYLYCSIPCRSRTPSPLTNHSAGFGPIIANNDATTFFIHYFLSHTHHLSPLIVRFHNLYPHSSTYNLQLITYHCFPQSPISFPLLIISHFLLPT